MIKPNDINPEILELIVNKNKIKYEPQLDVSDSLFLEKKGSRFHYSIIKDELKYQFSDIKKGLCIVGESIREYLGVTTFIVLASLVLYGALGAFFASLVGENKAEEALKNYRKFPETKEIRMINDVDMPYITPPSGNIINVKNNQYEIMIDKNDNNN